MDISISPNPSLQSDLPAFDWSFTQGDLVTGNDLETAIWLVLFTDRRAPTETIPPDGSNDPRGWWGDSYETYLAGSRLWTLFRAKKSDGRELLQRAKDICLEALQLFVTEGIAATVEVETSWVTPTEMGIVVTMTQPHISTAQVFRFQRAWAFV